MFVCLCEFANIINLKVEVKFSFFILFYVLFIDLYFNLKTEILNKDLKY